MMNKDNTEEENCDKDELHVNNNNNNNDNSKKHF